MNINHVVRLLNRQEEDLADASPHGWQDWKDITDVCFPLCAHPSLGGIPNWQTFIIPDSFGSDGTFQLVFARIITELHKKSFPGAFRPPVERKLAR